MSTWSRMVQYVDISMSQSEADEVLAWLRTQIDFVAGRILNPTPAKPGFRVHALFEDCGHDLPLPDGCRRVIVPSGFYEAWQ